LPNHHTYIYLSRHSAMLAHLVKIFSFLKMGQIFCKTENDRKNVNIYIKIWPILLPVLLVFPVIFLIFLMLKFSLPLKIHYANHRIASTFIRSLNSYPLFASPSCFSIPEFKNISHNHFPQKCPEIYLTKQTFCLSPIH
jgi:hypothetical protein